VKYTHTCPKCRSTDAVRVPGRVGAYRSGNNISVGPTAFNTVLVTRYVCLACGFVEEWIDRPQDLVKLRAKFG
jgi:predicted nucleic-acid-binding Zn-ribbon protein